LGAITKLLGSGKVAGAEFNDYMALELTENVHLHYRGLRLEFTPEEFLFIKDILCSLTDEEIETIKNRKYGFDESVIHMRITKDLPKNDWWKNKFQIERCRNGSVHLHINNLRVSLSWKDYKRMFGKK